MSVTKQPVYEGYPAMGWVANEGCFRLRAPTATFVELLFREHPAGQRQMLVPMCADTLLWAELDADAPPDAEPAVHKVAVWTAAVVPPLPFYRFRVHLGARTVDIPDPWSRAVVRRKIPGNPAWSVAQASADPPGWHEDDGDDLAAVDGAEIIYEAHIADMTAAPNAGARLAGTWDGFIDTQPAATGGLPHVLRMGCNVIELLPQASWPVLEKPRDGDVAGATHDNHWGYMPSFLLAAADYLTRAWQVTEPGKWVGIDRDGRFHDPALELQRAVLGMHKKGIKVVVDMVLNHVSLHDDNPLLLLDPGTWFRRTPAGELRGDSGCGNDLATEDPDMRGLLVHAIRRWIGDFHFDGVRLDLAELIDDHTLAMLHDEARELHHDPLLIAEPWSLRGHRADALAEAGWTVWNDRYRDAVRGRSPGEPGFVFGGRPGSSIKAALAGSIAPFGGRFADASCSLNYIESHDDHTFGDFVRLTLGQVAGGAVVERADIRAIEGRALAIHKLAAATLLASAGPVMIAQGQEFGRAKVTGGDRGPLCGNSYDRSDGTNHIDWLDRAVNPELVAWYARWIALRRTILAPAWQEGAELSFVRASRPAAVGYLLDGSEHRILVLLNADRQQNARFSGPKATWTPMAGHGDVQQLDGAFDVGPCAAVLLVAPAQR